MAMSGDGSVVARLTAELFGSTTIAEEPFPGSEPHGLLGGEAGAPLMLVPLASRKAAAASLLRWTDATSPADAARRLVGAFGIRSGADRAMVRRRVHVASRGAGLHEYFSSALGVPRVHLAATFGPPRPNQKPVVRIFDDAGTTVAFAKVGWNTLTRDLVDAETSFLSTKTRSLRIVNTPGVLHHGQWEGRSIGITESLVGRPPFRPSPPPNRRMIEEVAALSDRYWAPLTESPFWKRIAEGAGEPGRSGLTAVLDRWARVSLPFGHWHGDWAPWNMRHHGSGLIVWDWERNAAHMPLGFDVLHYEYQKRSASDGASADAFVASLEASGPMLTSLNVPDDARAAFGILYLTELQHRFGDPIAGEPVAALEHRRATARVLNEVVVRLVG